MKLTKRIKERGAAIYVTAVILVMAVPMAGLAIDGSILYILKCRLQGAVDGAALAAARSLARGSDDTAQVDSAKTAAVTYTKLNFPSNYFFTSDVTVDKTTDVNVDLSVAHQRTVTVTGHVVAPVLFMRYLNFTTANVNAVATAVRKDVNIVLVLDRSGSMTASGSCGPMKQAAINFLSNFAPGRDNLGIVSFATSVVVQQPATTAFTQAGLTTAINGIQCQGSTNSAAALWTAYDDLVRLNQTAALNFIVFFTDGEPTGVSVNMPIATTSGCSETAQVVPPDSIPGGFPAGFTGKYITGTYAVYVNGSAYIGLEQNTATANADHTPPDTTHSPTNDQVTALNSRLRIRLELAGYPPIFAGYLYRTFSETLWSMQAITPSLSIPPVPRLETPIQRVATSISATPETASIVAIMPRTTRACASAQELSILPTAAA